MGALACVCVQAPIALCVFVCVYEELICDMSLYVFVCVYVSGYCVRVFVSSH